LEVRRACRQAPSVGIATDLSPRLISTPWHRALAATQRRERLLDKRDALPRDFRRINILQ
jgi:hypothetical protein